jgi:hypothetical protein
MKNMQGLKVLFAVFSLMLLLSVTASAQTKKRTSCANTSDAAIARTVNNHIKRVKARNPRTTIRIDVRVKNKTVRLMVRRAPGSVHREVARLARNTRCVRKVEVTSPGCSSAGCPKNTYRCNEECVPCNDICTPRRPT